MRVSVQVSRLRYWPSLERDLGESASALRERGRRYRNQPRHWRRPRRRWFGVGTRRGGSRRGKIACEGGRRGKRAGEREGERERRRKRNTRSPSKWTGDFIFADPLFARLNFDSSRTDSSYPKVPIQIRQRSLIWFVSPSVSFSSSQRVSSSLAERFSANFAQTQQESTGLVKWNVDHIIRWHSGYKVLQIRCPALFVWSKNCRFPHSESHPHRLRVSRAFVSENERIPPISTSALPVGLIDN